MTPDLLPDEVWNQLNPSAAGLSRRARVQLAIAVVVAALVALIAILGQISGLLSSQLASTTSNGSASIVTHVVSMSFDMHNAGWFDEHIDAVDVDAPGARLVRSNAVGTTIAQGRSATISVVIRIVDCSHITPQTEVPIHLRLDRFWGEKTLTIGGFESTDLSWDACRGNR